MRRWGSPKRHGLDSEGVWSAGYEELDPETFEVTAVEVDPGRRKWIVVDPAVRATHEQIKAEFPDADYIGACRRMVPGWQPGRHRP